MTGRPKEPEVYSGMAKTEPTTAVVAKIQRPTMRRLRRLFPGQSVNTSVEILLEHFTQLTPTQKADRIAAYWERRHK